MSKAQNENGNPDAGVSIHSVQSPQETEKPKRSFGQRFMATLKEPGSALQIVLAAVVAIAIGMAVTTTVDNIPEAAPVILEIPGSLWLRALRATVLPLIITAIIIAVQNLKAMAKDGAKLARWIISYYVLTTMLAIVHSMIMVDLVWRGLMQEADAESLVVSEDDAETVAEREDTAPHDIVVSVAESFIPNNIVAALAEDSLLAVLVTAIIIGCLLKPEGSIMRAVREIEKITMIIITFLIKLAPIGVFFLILSNLMTLDISTIGQNLGVLIGASVCGMFIQLFIFLPAIFFGFTRMNPYAYWLKNSPAWITAWGSASSAATLPVTLRCVRARGVPDNIAKFTVPLGALINMDGTAIYFPVVVVFLAATQGINLNAGDYVIIVLLSTLSSIATTPIPSSSLVLTVMIAGAVNVPITGMYGVVVAIDWFIDRFRTATNVSGDMFAAKVMEKVTGIKDHHEAEIVQEETDSNSEGGRVDEKTSDRV